MKTVKVFSPPPLMDLKFPASLLIAAVLATAGVRSAEAQCNPQEPPVQHYTGGITGVCPCFVAGEEAGASFTIPAAHLPIQVLKIGIGWASQFGGTGQTLETGIHIYGAGLPNPGPRVATLGGPILTDGAINEFNIQGQLGTVPVTTSPVTVTLEFLTSNSGDFFAPSVGYDNGCTGGGANVINANPGGWLNACTAGVPGDWVFYMIYKKFCPASGVGDEVMTSNVPLFLMNPQPNPFLARTEIGFFLASEDVASVSVFDIQGRQVATLANESFAAGSHSVTWDGRGDGGEYLSPGLYFVRLEAGGRESVQKVILSE